MLEPVRPPEVPQPLDQELLAWAAGFFDGEGSTIARSHSARPGYYQVLLSVPQRGDDVVPEVLVRFREAALGTGTFAARDELGMYAWRSRGRSDAELVLALLWPYLGTVKREQAEVALERIREQYASGRYRERAPRFLPSLVPHPSRGVDACEHATDRAWAAGFLDAEGSFGVSRKGTRQRGGDWFRIRVSASQHSSGAHMPEVLIRLQTVLGVGRIERHGEPDDYKWVVEGRDAILCVLNSTQTWLGSVKLAQAEDALSRFDAQQRYRSTSETRCYRGHEYESIVTLPTGEVRKYCLTCARLNARSLRAKQGIKPRQFTNPARRYLA